MGLIFVILFSIILKTQNNQLNLLIEHVNYVLSTQKYNKHTSDSAFLQFN